MPTVTLSEVEQAKTWLADMFLADTQLISLLSDRVYIDQAQRRGFPYILINYMSGSDKNSLGTTREQTIINMESRVVDERVISDDARNAESRMDYLIQHTVKQLSGNFYFSARRVQPINRPEYDMNKLVKYINIGGIYRIWAYPKP